jgi:hypothetical protein
MKKTFLSVLVCIPIFFMAQKKTLYSQAGERIDPSLVNEKVGDSVKKINTIFHFKNDIKNFYIKILNLDGKTYAQGISEFIKIDFNSRKGGDLHRKVEKLTNIKIEDGNFTSDQIKASFIFLKERENPEKEYQTNIKLMVCTEDEIGNRNCRINDDEVILTPREFPGKYPQTAFTRLGVEDLKNKKPKELDLMKKEIYARYGYRFTNPEDVNYFYKQEWYEPVIENKDIELNELESDNVAMIDLFKKLITYKDINKKTYSHILPLETTSNTLYDKDALKSVQHIVKDSIYGKKCKLTEFNKKGIAIFQQDCVAKKDIYVNYFHNDFLIQHIDDLNDTFYYYNEKGLPYKSVKLDYTNQATEISYFNYDANENIIKKDIYQNNDFNSSISYDYDVKGNLKKEYYKDEDGSEHMVTKYIYDDDNLLTGYIKDEDLHCDYTYNHYKDVLLKTICYKIVNDTQNIKQRADVKAYVTTRGKDKRLISVIFKEKDSSNSSLNKIEVKYNK